MTQTHKVQLGEWLGVIASHYGLAHWATLWEHPVNAKLRELRASPDLLMAGDEVGIPDQSELGGTQVQTGTRVVFRVRAPDTLRIRLPELAAYVALFGVVAWELKVGDETHTGELTEDDDGTILVPLPHGIGEATLTIAGGEARTYAIGGLGPVEEPRGAMARLTNLGHTGASRAPAPGQQAVTDPFAESVKLFQRRHGLPPTGTFDDVTRDTLREAYGG